MSAEFEDRPYSDSHLDSPEYRKRLRRKLNTLIAVLEVACAKVRRSLAGPDPDIDRLNRIHKNLKDTLQVCRRARKALERCEQLPEDLPENLKSVGAEPLGFSPAENKTSARRPSLRSEEEKQKFTELGPIEAQEIRSVDLDALCRQLLG